ncbi:hypothetical protein F442_02139 [Phytophthora nicotianae P10297]|uniref:Coiled-coil domain-containing protein 43 n=6 Tax=Phytophthora nicotianae TaxID=4792 RepID=W3A148_PHYNI|nr:hypothetical protein F444_02190 [Phytophthora nicotianae P1976]ETP52926.1 hypothetical protein F442_02139 [Phytophthora nicotianae P10297]KUF90723.1 Coiled-coil domain-containing protein 43 [Phytophthora nicotianae]KUF97678.1 hypothetical protein AM588_10009537 [Phytophthora nicotianae]
MEAWVRDKVSRLNLDASVYVEYALGLLQDEDMDVSERVASVIAVFSGAADGLVAQDVLDQTLDETKMTQDVEKLLQAEQQQSQQEAELRLAEKQMKDLQIREKQRQEAEEAAERERQKAANRLKNMTREEIAAREQLISNYGFTVMSEFDEEGNVVKIKDKEKVTEDVGPANSNKQRVQQAQNAMREKMKKDHEKKVKYEKELLAKDKARKDKAKKRTMKKEKQRGCG